MIVVKDLVKKFKSPNKDEEVIALDHLSLTLPDKGFVAIYGASGCGKSTLLNVLGGLDLADEGEMIVNGRNTSKFSKGDWNSYRNQEVGFIFQNYYLLPHLNVKENIAITLQMSKQTKDMDKKIHDALVAVELPKYGKRYPKQLSGGQQQRVAIARALISNPTIILADEPTGALDEKSSKIVMHILKEISKEHLVVMVTHNERMAKEYADRMIEISYGKILNDEDLQKVPQISVNREPLKRVHLPFSSSFKWSCRNVIKKKGRSIPIAIATAIGLASAGLVLSMTKGVNDFVAQAQKEAIGDYPVYVSCYPKTSSESNKDNLVEFPDVNEIIIEKSDYEVQEHYISMQKQFMDYMDDMPKDYYAGRQTNESLTFNLFTSPSTGSYKKVSSTSYTMSIAPYTKKAEEGNDAYKFIKEQYDVLAGHLPESDEDLTLVLDTFNRIDLGYLTNMGFDTSGENITFDEILNKKEYHVVSNDDYFIQHDETKTDYFGKHYYEPKGDSEYKDLYENHSVHEMKITGIIRPKKDSPNPLYKTILLYNPSFLETVIRPINSASQIVKDQKEYGITYNTYYKERKAFEDTYVNGRAITANYQYESRLVDIGSSSRVTAIYYYTATFQQRAQIADYIDKYVKGMDKDSDIVLKTKDYLETVTAAFSSIASTFSSVMLIFSLVTIIVAMILTAILTYISVNERKREIGLLRSLGARRIDISLMFIIEATIIGIVAGLLGIGLCFGLAPIVAKVVVSLISAANLKILTPDAATFSTIQPWVVPTLFIAAILIGVVACLLPAIAAGRKRPAESLKE